MKTIYSINNVHLQVIYPPNFSIKAVNCKKQNINEQNYFNLGYFTYLKNGDAIPVGNLAINGVVLAEACSQEGWINLSRHKLTTLCIFNDNSMGFVKTDRISTLPNLKFAVSGIPIIRNNKKVELEQIVEEGYFGNELYDTWHGFLGIRENQLVYVASNLSYDYMVYLMEVLNIKDAIKIDGGGSFILHNGGFEIATPENRKIHNIGCWWG